LQVSEDAAEPGGLRRELRPLGVQPSWWWQYTLRKSGDVSLKFMEGAAEAAEKENAPPAKATKTATAGRAIALPPVSALRSQA
jgi:hypothetical protein